ncbi:MAG: DUF2508 family protein [Oscillospiraceae bacterium]|nr:DUF2508 family protein [Oscillospiraceae bacterium]
MMVFKDLVRKAGGNYDDLSLANKLVREIKEVSRMRLNQEQKINYTNDDDLLEALIFECKALEKRHDYLLKRAKEMKLENSLYEL